MDREVPEIPGFLVSPEISEALKFEVSRILHTRKNDFPGSQPVSFERDHIQNNLLQQDYFVCEKSDGLRCLLLLLVNKDTGEEGCFLITRENEYYMVPDFHFPVNDKDFSQPHDGTILDGELVLSTNPVTKLKETRYLIFDCLLYNRERVMHKILTKRLYFAAEKFHKPFQKMRQAMPQLCVNFPFKVDFKNMSQSFKVSKVFKEMKNLTYVTDGLIFTCCETPYIPGTDSTLLKWKPLEENTVDFKIKLEIPEFIDESIEDHHNPDKSYPNYDVKPVFKLYIWEGGDDEQEVPEDIDPYEYKTSFDNYVEFSELYVSDEEFEYMKSLNQPLNGRIAETRKDEEGRWRFLRFRDDKLNGNFAKVVKKVLNSIKDSVKKEELIELEPRLASMWKNREVRRKEEERRRLELMKQLHKLKLVVDEKGIAFKPPEGLLDPLPHGNGNGHTTASDSKANGVSFKPPPPPSNQLPGNDYDDDDDDDEFDDLPSYDKPVSPRYNEDDYDEDSHHDKKQKV